MVDGEGRTEEAVGVRLQATLNTLFLFFNPFCLDKAEHQIFHTAAGTRISIMGIITRIFLFFQTRSLHVKGAYPLDGESSITNVTVHYATR
jgi:hypothetical protein